MKEQETFTTRIEVNLCELAGEHKDCWTYEHEHFYSFLTWKVAEKTGRDLDYFQIVDYSIVAHEPAAITIEVEGYEEA